MLTWGLLEHCVLLGHSHHPLSSPLLSALPSPSLALLWHFFLPMVNQKRLRLRGVEGSLYRHASEGILSSLCSPLSSLQHGLKEEVTRQLRLPGTMCTDQQTVFCVWPLTGVCACAWGHPATANRKVSVHRTAATCALQGGSTAFTHIIIILISLPILWQKTSLLIVFKWLLPQGPCWCC